MINRVFSNTRKFMRQKWFAYRQLLNEKGLESITMDEEAGENAMKLYWCLTLVINGSRLIKTQQPSSILSIVERNLTTVLVYLTYIIFGNVGAPITKPAHSFPTDSLFYIVMYVNNLNSCYIWHAIKRNIYK